LGAPVACVNEKLSINGLNITSYSTLKVSFLLYLSMYFFKRRHARYVPLNVKQSDWLKMTIAGFSQSDCLKFKVA